MTPRMNELIQPPSDALKDRVYVARMRRWAARTEDMARSGVDRMVIDIMIAMSDGGYCPNTWDTAAGKQVCGKVFKRIDYDLPFGKGHYFKPSCSCYPRCHRCGYHLIMESVMGGMPKDRCPNCDHNYHTGMSTRKRK